MTDEMAKRPCAFLVKIREPLLTQVEILKILSDRNVRVSTMHLHYQSRDEGILIIHCLIEKDRSRYIMHLLEKLKSVIGTELLEGKGSHIASGK
jgi:hypothetical protein